jgi:hypothetical protein
VIAKGLFVEWLWHDADVASILVSASNSEFAGAAKPYIGLDELDEIANLLKGFPRNASDVRELSLGTSDESSAGGFVSFRFSCVDGAGHARVELHFESKNGTRTGKFSIKDLESASFFAQVEASAIDDFVGELKRVGSVKQGNVKLSFAM